MSEDKNKTIDFEQLRSAVGEHELAQFHGGELSAQRREEITLLLETDASLKAALAELEAEKRAFLTRHPVSRFAASLEAAPEARGLGRLLMSRYRGLAIAAPLLSLSAVALLMLPNAGVAPEDIDPIITLNQSKGRAVEIAFFKPNAPGAPALRGQEGERLAPGARIQLAVKGEGKSRVVVGIDGAGVLTVYDRKSEGSAKGPATLSPLGQSMVLDESLGIERYFVIFADDELSEIERRVRAAAKSVIESRADLQSVTTLLLPKEYEQASLYIEKVERAEKVSP